MNKAAMYGIVSEQKRAVDQKLIEEDNNILNSSRMYPDHSSDVIAKVVQYCFDTSTVGKFKDLGAIADLVKENLGYSVLSTFKNVVVFSSIDDIVIQYSRNDPQDISKVNTMTITVKANLVENDKLRYSKNVQGDCKTYTMVKNSHRAPNGAVTYSERILSRSRISDLNAVSFKELSEEGKQLFEKMVICSSLFEPVLKRLANEQVGSYKYSTELDDMFNDVNYDQILENQDENVEEKGASL